MLNDFYVDFGIHNDLDIDVGILFLKFYSILEQGKGIHFLGQSIDIKMQTFREILFSSCLCFGSCARSPRVIRSCQADHGA